MNKTYPGDQFITYINVKPLCCTLETNIILHAKYTSNKKKSVEMRGQKRRREIALEKTIYYKIQ